MIGHVSGAAMAGMIFSAVIAIGLPVFLLILGKKKLGAKVRFAWYGAAVFVLFALILEQLLHSVMLNAAGDALNSNIWLYALYGGLAAAAFEETGRFVAMKYWMKKELSRENAVMYGVGHGGVEAILIVGVTCIDNLITSFLINSGQLEKSLAAVGDGTGKELAIQSLSVLWTTPGYQFFLAGIERLSAIVLQICLSYLVYRAVKQGKKLFFAASFLLHFLVDALTVILSNMVSIVVLEIVLLMVVAVLALWVKRMYGEEALEKSDLEMPVM